MELDGTNRFMSEFSHHETSVMCNVTKYEDPLSKCSFLKSVFGGRSSALCCEAGTHGAHHLAD